VTPDPLKPLLCFMYLVALGAAAMAVRRKGWKIFLSPFMPTGTLVMVASVLMTFAEFPSSNSQVFINTGMALVVVTSLIIEVLTYYVRRRGGRSS
jgi:hypothetical protein